LVVVVQEIVVGQQVNLHQSMHMVVVLEEQEPTVLVKTEVMVVQVAVVVGVIVHTVMVDPV
jgi:hypothetical protein